MTVASESEQILSATIPVADKPSFELDDVISRTPTLRQEPHNKNLTITRHLICIFIFPIIQLLFRLEFFFWSLLISFSSMMIRMLSSKSRTLPFVCFVHLLYSLQLLSYSGFYDLEHKRSLRDGSLSALRGRDTALSRVDVESLKDHAPAHLLHWESKLLTALHEPDITPSEISHGVSVVIAAYQEYDYIERTIESILNQTASLSLTEILVIDDHSEKPLITFLRPDLTHHKRVIFHRNEERRGLIKSKQLGGDMATGSFVIFLDGHVKPAAKWVPYLLREMTTNPARVVVPAIPILEKDIWDVTSLAVGYKMMFDWDLSFHWFEDNNDEVPCMSGGLLGITKEWWNKTTGYDPGMRLWGSENIEQSIKTWMSGGEIVVARNSKVAHVFRRTFPYTIDHQALAANKLRLVEVWFDDWRMRAKLGKKYRDPQKIEEVIGDISQQQALRARLAGNRTFDWYVRRFRNTFLRKRMIDLASFILTWRDPEGTKYCLIAVPPPDNSKAKSTRLNFVKECDATEVNLYDKWGWYLFGDILDRHPSIQKQDLSYSFNELYSPASIVGNRYRPTLEFAASEMCLGPVTQHRAHHATKKWVLEDPELSACKPAHPNPEFRDLHQWGGFSFSDEINQVLLNLEMTHAPTIAPPSRMRVPISWGSLCVTATEHSSEIPSVTLELCRDGDERQLFAIENIALHTFPTKK